MQNGVVIPGVGTVSPEVAASTYKIGTVNMTPYSASNPGQYQPPRPLTQAPTPTPVASPYYQPSVPQGGAQPTNQYAVVTSKPATDQVNAITNDYTTNISPNVERATTTNAATNAAATNLPVIDGYNVSSTRTGNVGETTATLNGQTFYVTPQQPAATASDIKSILGGGAGGTTPAATPTETATAQTGINPATETSTYTAAVQAGADALTSASSQFTAVINSLTAGAIPFTPAQQALIDATNNAFKQMTDQADLKAAALSSETGGVSNKVNAMGGELIKISADQAAAIAKLESGFQTDNFDQKYKTLTEGYAAFKDAETAKMDALTKIHDSVMTTYQNALKAVQDQKTAQLEQQKEAETERHNKAQEALDALGTYSVVTNPDGTQSIFNNKTGKIVGTPNGASSPEGSILNGTLTPEHTGVPIIDMNTKFSTNGIPYVDGSNLSGKQADAAQLRAARMGLPYMGKQQSAQLAKIEDAKSNLEAVAASVMDYLPRDAAGRITAGPENKLSAYLQTNDQLASFGTFRTAAIGILQALAGGQGSGLRINQAEINMSLANDIPNITDTVGTAQAKMDHINTLLNNSERSIFGGNIYDKYNPNSPAHQAASKLDSLFGLGISGGQTSDTTVSTAFSNIGI